MGLAACSLAAQGLWVRMLCVMHDLRPYGVLSLSGKEVHPNVLGRMVGATPEEVYTLLKELEDLGVFSRTSQGWIYSRRMVRDEQTRSKRAAGGYESLKNPKVPQRKSPPTKDPHQGPLVSPPRGGSSQGSPSVAGAVPGSVAFPSSAVAADGSINGAAAEATSELPAAAAGSGEGLGETPDDLRQHFAALAISDAVAQQLAHQAGGWEEVRFAVNRLIEKQANGEVHKASGLLVARVRELAEEGRGLSESRFRGLELEFPEAFRDSRWLQLNSVCRLNPSVTSAWGSWWKAHRSMKASPLNQDVALFQEERRAWKHVLECALECHPDKAAIQERVKAKLEKIPKKSEGDLVYMRASTQAISKELGLAETPVSEVAS